MVSRTTETVTVSSSLPGYERSQMELFWFVPEAPGPHPAIILAQHIPVGHTGIENDEFTLATAQRYAEAGYVVAVPFIFHWWPKDEDMMVKAKASRDLLMKADLLATRNALLNHSSVDPARIGIVGHCWGGRVSWLGACYLPDVKACVVFYGGRIKLAMGDGPPAIELASDMNCSVAGFFGNDDQNPTPEDVDDYEQALRRAGIQYEFHRYDGAGHAFQNFPTPERFNQQASDDAWDKVMAFLGENLAG